MPSLEQIRERVLKFVPAAQITIVNDAGSAGQHSLLVDNAHARAVAGILHDDAELAFDYCSNVTGVDFLDKEVVETKKVSQPDPAGGADKIVEEKTKRTVPGFLEVVYHLYSMARKSPEMLVIRTRTGNRSGDVSVPSLTPIWKSCDFQEREVFDLFGVVFEGHPDLRRLLMWENFKDFPMRKDYVAPDDFEYEPTPHDDVLQRAIGHYPKIQKNESRGGAEK